MLILKECLVFLPASLIFLTQEDTQDNQDGQPCEGTKFIIIAVDKQGNASEQKLKDLSKVASGLDLSLGNVSNFGG